MLYPEYGKLAKCVAKIIVKNLYFAQQAQMTVNFFVKGSKETAMKFCAVRCQNWEHFNLY